MKIHFYKQGNLSTEKLKTTTFGLLTGPEVHQHCFFYMFTYAFR